MEKVDESVEKQNKDVEKMPQIPIENDSDVENTIIKPIIENISQEKDIKEQKTDGIFVENIEIPQVKLEKYEENIKPQDKNYITDDQFFDDFFSDDE